VDTIEDKLRAFFGSKPAGLAAVYLFGSVGRGDARADSDVDVAVLYQKDPPATLEGLPLDLEGELERLLGLPVDVIALNRAPVDLVHRVLRDGALILEADREARIRFEVKSRAEYFDLLPTLELYRRMGRRSA
jgi:predicted nucleotidyltransferase